MVNVPSAPATGDVSKRRPHFNRFSEARAVRARLSALDELEAEIAEHLRSLEQDAVDTSDGRTRCDVCADGSCMLCDDDGFVPADVHTAVTVRPGASVEA